MKNIYSLVILAFAGIGTSFGQMKPAMAPELSLEPALNAPKQEKTINQKAAGVSIWTDDFSTSTNWVINNGTQTGSTFGWTIDAVNDSWFFPNGITSTSGGNYAELSNGNGTALGVSIGVTYTMTTANPIDITTAGTNLALDFEQFGARFTDAQEVQVSTNGTTFVTVGDNLDIAVLSASGGSAYPNPNLRSFNISSAIAGATQVWIRFTWTSRFPTSTAGNAWITYGWYIDDINLRTLSDNDLTLVSSYYETAGVKYTQIPQSQIAPINFAAIVNKTGINTLRNATYTATINPGAIAVSSTPRDLSGTANDTLLTAGFTPTGLGTYNVTSVIVHDSIDDNPANNVVPNASFAVTPFIYALDNGTVSGTTQDGDLLTTFECGNIFDIYSDVQTWGVFARIGTSTPIGINVVANIREFDPASNSYILVAQAPSVQVTAPMINVQRFFKFTSPLLMEAGKTYLVTLQSDDEGLRIANAGSTSNPGTSLIQFSDEPATWFFQLNTPWIRLNFDPSLSVTETVGALSISDIYPNPTTNISTVSFSLENSEQLDVVVYNTAGQAVYRKDMGIVNAGASTFTVDASAFESGVYFVNIISNDGIVTKKLIKN